jgi:phosphate transport system permease protein
MNTKKREQIDILFKFIFKGTGLITIALLAGIFIMLFSNSILFFFKISPVDFFTGSQWDPETHYSIQPLLVSTLLVAVGSMLIAVPLGIFTAAYLSELAPKKLQMFLQELAVDVGAIS